MPPKQRRGMILLVVLVIITVLAVLGTSFSFRMSADLNSVTAQQAQQQARWAAESGIDRVIALLRDKRTDLDEWYNNPRAFRRILVWAPDRVGGSESLADQEPVEGRPAWRFSIVSYKVEGDQAKIRYGLTDEAGKINLNTASRMQLLALFDQFDLEDVNSEELADALIDWRDKDDEPVTINGAESSYYATLEPPYKAKNKPLETVEELLMVKGFDGLILFGEDYNRNGYLDDNEDDGPEGSFPPDNGDGILERGLLPYVTVYSWDWNLANDNKRRLDINSTKFEQRDKLPLHVVTEILPSTLDFIALAQKRGYKFKSIGELVGLQVFEDGSSNYDKAWKRYVRELQRAGMVRQTAEEQEEDEGSIRDGGTDENAGQDSAGDQKNGEPSGSEEGRAQSQRQRRQSRDRQAQDEEAGDSSASDDSSSDQQNEEDEANSSDSKNRRKNGGRSNQSIRNRRSQNNEEEEQDQESSGGDQNSDEASSGDNTESGQESSQEDTGSRRSRRNRNRNQDSENQSDNGSESQQNGENEPSEGDSKDGEQDQEDGSRETTGRGGQKQDGKKPGETPEELNEEGGEENRQGDGKGGAQGGGKSKGTPINSPVTAQELPALLDLLTTNSMPALAGLINVNTASVVVLRTVPGLTEQDAEAIVAKRNQLSGADKMTPAWLVESGAVDPMTFALVSNQLTSRSIQFTIDAIGFADHVDVWKRIQVVVEMRGQLSQIKYYRDISSLTPGYPVRDDERSEGFAFSD